MVIFLIVFVLIAIAVSLIWNAWKRMCDDETKFLDELKKEVG